MNYILEAENIQKQYPKDGFRLKDISLKLPYGSILGLIGENGSGKTTTLNIILNLRKKDSGKVSLFGQELTDKDLHIKEKIGVVFDENCFPKTASAKNMSKVYRSIYKNWNQDYFFDKLKTFNIDINKKFQDYSKGMLMAASIITTLAYKPQLLILDEPTAGLDPVHREEMLELLLEFVGNEQNSIIFSSHITTDVEKIADYVTLIHKGESIITEEKDNLIYNYGIIQCGKEQFDQLDTKHMISYLKKDYQYSILVSKQDAYSERLPNMLVENPTLEEIMYIISRGTKV